MAYAFISYADPDAKKAVRLADDLRKLGVDVWLDRHGRLGPGQRWCEEISKAIHDSEWAIVLLSEKSLRWQGYFQKEIEEIEKAALGRPKKAFVIPVRLDACQPSQPWLKKLQRVDLFRGWRAGVRRIADALAEPLPLEELILSGLPLSKRARGQLAQSRFVLVGRTRAVLMNLVESAAAEGTILAVCGTKGDYSTEYYRKNFERCRRVKRIFSYEAIRDEMTVKGDRHALNGLKLHLATSAEGPCRVDVVFIPRGCFIRNLGTGIFDPPLSFGLAMLLDGEGSPERAVAHWEVDAKALRHLLDIEGVVIDRRETQSDLLAELVELHEALAGSNQVLTSKLHRPAIDAAVADLEKIWKTTPSGRKGP